MAGLRQNRRGNALRPIIREPDTGTDSAEYRALRSVAQAGRRVARGPGTRYNSLGNALAGNRTSAKAELNGGTYNGPVGSA